MKTAKPRFAKIYYADGRIEDITPAPRKKIPFSKLREVVGGLVQFVPMPHGCSLVCNDEGKLIGLPKNENATALWMQEYPIEKYPLNNDELIVGDVLYLTNGTV